MIDSFKYYFIVNSIDTHYLNKTVYKSWVFCLTIFLRLSVAVLLSTYVHRKDICSQPSGIMLLVKCSDAVSSHRKLKKLQLIIMRKTNMKLPAACCELGVTACGPGKVRDRGTRIYAPVSMVTCAWFCWSVYYRKVMTHITQWGFLHYFCIRVLENQRHFKLVNLHSSYISKIKMVIFSNQSMGHRSFWWESIFGHGLKYLSI